MRNHYHCIPSVSANANPSKGSSWIARRHWFSEIGKADDWGMSLLWICVRRLNEKQKNNTHSYMSICAFPATQSWMDPDPCLILTADASCFFVTFTSPKFKCFITDNFPNALTTKLFPDESQEKDTLVGVCVCSWRKSGRRSNIKRLVSCAILELTSSEDVWCSSRTRRLNLWEPNDV